VKCGAVAVRAARNGVVMGEYAQTQLRPNLGPDFRGMARNQMADVWAFGCTSCGYVELYVLDPAGIAFMQQNWEPVGHEGPPPPA
jgi:hypothetical protein